MLLIMMDYKTQSLQAKYHNHQGLEMGPTGEVKKAAAKEQLVVYRRVVYKVDRRVLPATERRTGLEWVERSPERLLSHNGCCSRLLKRVR